MQYIEKDGTVKDIPLVSVQPTISPDDDNALYEASNGLKVDKSGDGNGSIVALTKSQYNALPESEKQNENFAYFVEDNSESAEAIVAKVLAKEIAKHIFDDIYPIGSYAFGVKPNIGTWVEVVGDRALWLKNTVADGTTIAQALPNITGDVAVNYISADGYGALGGAAGSAATGNGAFRVDSTANGAANRKWPSGVTSTGDARKYPNFRFNASNSNSVYKDGASVQPNAYVMKVYKRTA